MEIRNVYDNEYNMPILNELLKIDSFNILSATKQNKKWHKEMDVLSHSISCLKSMKEETLKRGIEGDEEMILLMSAILHDIGKSKATIFSEEQNDWSSNNHDIVGYSLIKDIFSDDKDTDLVETIAWFVKYHMKPLYWSEEYSNINFSYAIEECHIDSLQCGKYKKIANFKNLILLKEMDNKGAIFIEYDNWKEKLIFIYNQIINLGYE